MTRQDEIDFERLMRPHWRRLFFGLVGTVGISLAGAFWVGQAINEANAAVADLRAQASELRDLKAELVETIRRIDGLDAQLRVHGNDLNWIKDALRRSGGRE